MKTDEDGRIVIKGRVMPVAMFEPTPRLRWFIEQGERELQQLWVDKKLGHQEWRPIEEEVFP